MSGGGVLRRRGRLWYGLPACPPACLPARPPACLPALCCFDWLACRLPPYFFALFLLLLLPPPAAVFPNVKPPPEQTLAAGFTECAMEGLAAPPALPALRLWQPAPAWERGRQGAGPELQPAGVAVQRRLALACLLPGPHLGCCSPLLESAHRGHS